MGGGGNFHDKKPESGGDYAMADGRQQNECETVPSLLQQEGALGVSRLHICQSFTGPTICTLVYLPATVRISIIDAREREHVPFRGTVMRSLESFRRLGPLASWQLLRAAAFASPSCSTPNVEDGVSYHHAALDWDGGIEVRWSNPGLWPQHRSQCELVDAYQSLLDSGLLLEPGTAVNIRSGSMSGCVGRIDRLERNNNRVRVIAEMMGGCVAVELAASEIELAPE